MDSRKTPFDDTSLVAKLRLSDASSEPYYLQLQRQIAALIDNGSLPEGSNLPSERDLAHTLKISRTTVKRCYDELRQAQALATHGRGGTVVRVPPKVSPTLHRLKGFTEEMTELGLTPSTRLVEHEVTSDRTMASLFKRPSTASFLRILRVRMANGTPMSREIAWYDLTLAPSLEHWDTSGSAYQFLESHCGIKLSWAEQSIEAVLSSAEESRVFDFDKPSPCLLLKRKSYTAREELVEYVEGTFRGDAYAYRLKLQTD